MHPKQGETDKEATVGQYTLIIGPAEESSYGKKHVQREKTKRHIVWNVAANTLTAGVQLSINGGSIPSPAHKSIP